LQQFGAKASQAENGPPDNNGDGDWAAGLDDELELSGIEDMRNYRDYSLNGVSLHIIFYGPINGETNYN